MENRRGTITDLDGRFELNNVSENDTIIFYFAGFEKKKLAAGDIDSEVKLDPLEKLLDDILVLPEDFAVYRKMMAFGHNGSFWDCYKTFRVGKTEKKEEFLRDSRTVTHEGLYKASQLSDMGMYEFPYRMWSKKRVYMRPPKDTTEAIPMVQDGVTPNSQKYELVAQILFEIDDQCDSLAYRTVTIFDPFQSFYKFERTPRSVAFHNVYFDLMEIARRELVVKLDAIENPTREIWTTIYEAHMKETRQKMELYFKEVGRGNREEEFLKWNAIVVNTLGIDNNMMFSAPEEE